MNLRAYQREALERTRAAIAAGNKRILIAIPTGGGKTICASAIIKSAIAKGRRVLFVAHRRELIRQPFEKLTAAGVRPEDIGIILAGVPFPTGGQLFGGPVTWETHARRRPNAPVQIASIDTLRHRQVPNADILIIDESHRALAKSYLDLIEAVGPSCIVLGLTATPVRTDGRGLGDVYQELVQVVQYRELAAEGFLVEPIYFEGKELPELEGIKITAGDYNQRELAAAVDQPGLVGDVVRHWEERGNGAPTLCFAASVDHSRNIAERFRAAGYAWGHLDGKTPKDERQAILTQLERRELRGVSNFGVLIEGIDIPAIKTIILARPTESEIIYRQAIGRGSRPDGTDTPFVVLDHARCWRTFGLPHWDRVWELNSDRRKRGDALAPAKSCPECQAVVTASCRSCPECGHAFPPPKPKEAPKERAGSMVLVNGDDDRGQWDRVVAEYLKHNEDNVVPRLPGWCFHRFRKLTGRRPPRHFRPPPLSAEQRAIRTQFETLKQIGEANDYDYRWAYKQTELALRGIHADVEEIAV